MFVDDVPPVPGECADAIAQSGYVVVRVAASDAAVLLDRESFDLIVLATHLPATAQFEACCVIRERSDVPVVFLAEGGSDQDRLLAFDLGADDYIQRPAAIERRFHALLRRRLAPPGRSPRRPPRYHPPSCGSRDARQRHTRGAHPREFDLLRLLLTRRGEVLSTDVISEAVWGYETFGSRNFVEPHISRLRGKLKHAGVPDVVATVRGVGYVIR